MPSRSEIYSRVVAKTASYAVNPAIDASGTLFTNMGAAGAVTFTLPTPNLALLGRKYEFCAVAAQNVIVAGAASGDLTTRGNGAADNVGLQTSGDQIGGSIEVKCVETAASTYKWQAQPVGVVSFSVDGTEEPIQISGTDVTSSAAELNILDGVTATAAELNQLDGLSSTGAIPVMEYRSFTEDGSTTLTGTVTLPAGSVLLDIAFLVTALFDDSVSASLDVGDADDADGWFAAINVKATDLLVGEVLSINGANNWGGKNGVYQTTAGRKGQAIAAYSGIYVPTASEVIAVVTTGNQDGTAGRGHLFVTYAVPTAVAATGA